MLGNTSDGASDDVHRTSDDVTSTSDDITRASDDVTSASDDITGASEGTQKKRKRSRRKRRRAKASRKSDMDVIVDRLSDKFCVLFDGFQPSDVTSRRRIPRERIRCFRCHKFGHYARSCFTPWEEIRHTSQRGYTSDIVRARARTSDVTARGYVSDYVPRYKEHGNVASSRPPSRRRFTSDDVKECNSPSPPERQRCRCAGASVEDTPMSRRV